MRSEAAEAVVASMATKATYGGGAVGFFGWLLSNQGIGLIGACIAAGGWLVNWYYKHRDDKRRERADARQAALDKLREEYIRKGRRTDTDLDQLGGVE